MEVRAKKALGQHFLTDLSIAQRIADALETKGSTAHETNADAPGMRQESADGPGKAMDTESGLTGMQQENTDCPEKTGKTESFCHGKQTDVLEVGPGMGVLTQYLLQREDISLKMVEIDTESVDYLLAHFPQVNGRLLEADFLKLKLEKFFPGKFCVIGNFPYNISSQIFFKILEYREQVPQVVCMIQKEVAERIAEKPGTKTYGILSVLLQAWYEIEYLFTVGEGAFNPPPKVKSAVIRLRRNSRTSLGCDEKLFKAIVKTGFNQRRKTLRNSLKPLISEKASREGWSDVQRNGFASAPVFDLRPERLSVEDFVELANMLG
ncbi:MAG: 16S rRNA (adenine(1518)-N(6)/adenine(1519)-N(6))-dimethyltransferase RsmA [Bacteroidales bacterium]|nr:16S rRNA (adenine(1518)-N(6)/adenine(1519)-N(6))-dimethyltransferase RsmA [Bacteroidales bacterium]